MADPRLVMAMDFLANVYTAEKQYAKAEPLYNRALSITEQTQGPESPSLSVCLDHLGAYYTATGQFTKAEAAYRRIIAIDEKAFGPFSPTLLGTLYALSNVLRNEARPAEADEVQKRRDEISAREQRLH
jgi:tetratricopeptide (TPR) repeat protein